MTQAFLHNGKNKRTFICHVEPIEVREAGSLDA
jgi:hypothetical protein